MIVEAGQSKKSYLFCTCLKIKQMYKGRGLQIHCSLWMPLVGKQHSNILIKWETWATMNSMKFHIDKCKFYFQKEAIKQNTCLCNGSCANDRGIAIDLQAEFEWTVWCSFCQAPCDCQLQETTWISSSLPWLKSLFCQWQWPLFTYSDISLSQFIHKSGFCVVLILSHSVVRSTENQCICFMLMN